MLPFEDIAVQRADLPPISSKHTEPWAPGLLRTVGAAWIMVDLADPACAKRVLVIGAELAQRKIKQDEWPEAARSEDGAARCQQVISSIGNYAIGIDWNDGHNSGIYSFDHLRSLGERAAGKIVEDV